MKWSCAWGVALAGALVFVGAESAQSAESVAKTLNVDLAPLIDAAASKRERFAVSLPHSVSLGDVDAWTRAAGSSTWRYSVRIPTAVSMSFHADRFNLPQGAVLEVTGVDGSAATYVPTDGGKSGLWSRIQRGDTLRFELRVPTGSEAQVDFKLASLQPGYRALGGGVPDHPHFRSLRKSQAAGAATCVENFSCHATTENSHNADATAAIVIGGVSICTATLMNNVRNDATPYLLTARHCQDTPGSGVVVYWDAVAACGTPMGAVYDTTSTAYVSSVDTVFEQQDVWLMRLNVPLSAQRIYFAGWDATGGAFVGGYSPHHAMGRSRQYAEWFGQAALVALSGSVLEVGYDSEYWGVVNSIGSVGSGASGGGLFDMNHRLVGVASMAYLQNGPGSDSFCPATSPPAPTTETATALYNSLSAVWESNADPTSATNPVTLKSLLDPDNTGARTSDGFEMLSAVALAASNSFSDTGRAITLTWHGGAATSCTASGGVTGDGWAGMRATSGSAEIIQYQAGLTTYTLRCSDGTRFATRSVRVNWNLAQPSLFLAVSTHSAYLGTTIDVIWRGTALPCVASGGVPGDGWAGTKSPNDRLDVPLLQPGEHDYTMTCGTGPRAATQTVRLTATAPFAELSPATTTIRVNSELLVMQAASGVHCSRTGGAPNDGWTSATGSFPIVLRSAAPGTYRYTLSCVGGPHGSHPAATATMDITYTTDTPAATLSASQPIAEQSVGIIVVDDPRFAIEFEWLSNIAPCQLTYDGPGDNDGNVHPEMISLAAGKKKSWQFAPGIYVYTITCRSGNEVATASTSVEFTPTQPRVELSRGDPSIPIVRDVEFTITVGSVLSPCVASSGAPGDGWAGPITAFTQVIAGPPGDYVYTATCGTGAQAATGSMPITVPPETLTFEPHAAQALAGHGVPLSWTGTVGNCVQFGDWSSPAVWLPSGSLTANSEVSGVRTYGIRCGRTNFVEATTQVTWLPVPTVEITASAASATVNQPVTLTWSATDAESCLAQDATGTGIEDWSGLLPASGSRTVTRTAPGAIGFYVNCGDVLDAVVVEWRPVVLSPQPRPAPAVTLTIDQTTRVVGQPVLLTWSATHSAACRARQGASGDGWTGALPVSGTRSVTAMTPGVHTWQVVCEGAPPAATASVSATFTAAPSGNNSGGGSSGGGGGSLDWLLLALLALSGLARGRPRAALQVSR